MREDVFPDKPLRKIEARSVPSHVPVDRSSPHPKTGSYRTGTASRHDLDQRYIAALRHLGVADRTLQDASALAARQIQPIHSVLSSKFALSDHVMARATARVFGLTYARGPDFTVDAESLSARLKLGLDFGHMVMVRTRPEAEPAWVLGYSTQAVDRLRKMTEAQTEPHNLPMIATRQTLMTRITEDCGRKLADHATFGLFRRAPVLSAAYGGWATRKALLAAATALLAAGLWRSGISPLASLGLLLSLILAAQTAVRLLTCLFGIAWMWNGNGAPSPDRRTLKDADLPPYSVLIPLHREASLLPQIAEVVARFDYPADKLDIKILLEASDTPTLEAARARRWPGQVTILEVPDLGPKTKPKALNAALPFALGDIVVVYDAEDKPDPGQLRLAAETFAAAPHETAVLQARLTYFNRTENWLSGQFAIEYAVHFGFLLPALERLGIPLPLGGTSNHIRTDILRAMGGWDAFNVTEDADLGLRMQAFGCKARMIDSVTEEEAACQPLNWLKQRTRWQKGWLQTYGVFLRRPFHRLRSLGILRFLGTQALILGQIFSPVTHLVFFATAWVAWRPALSETIYSVALADIAIRFAIFNFLMGYGASLLLGSMAITARNWQDMRWAILSTPIYWLAIGVATLRALAQMVHDPVKWEKTRHQVSGLVRTGVASTRFAAKHRKDGRRLL